MVRQAHHSVRSRRKTRTDPHTETDGIPILRFCRRASCCWCCCQGDRSSAPSLALHLHRPGAAAHLHHQLPARQPTIVMPSATRRPSSATASLYERSRNRAGIIANLEALADPGLGVHAGFVQGGLASSRMRPASCPSAASPTSRYGVAAGSERLERLGVVTKNVRLAHPRGGCPSCIDASFSSSREDDRAGNSRGGSRNVASLAA